MLNKWLHVNHVSMVNLYVIFQGITMRTKDYYKGHSHDWLVTQIMYRDEVIDNLHAQLDMFNKAAPFLKTDYTDITTKVNYTTDDYKSYLAEYEKLQDAIDEYWT